MPVVFNISNYTKCLCPVCKVQAGSDCIDDKREGWRETRKLVGGILEAYPDYPETYELEVTLLAEHEAAREQNFTVPDKTTMKELYCSIGESECGDIDGDRRCLCGDCAVWVAAGLREKYFCIQGAAG